MYFHGLFPYYDKTVEIIMYIGHLPQISPFINHKCIYPNNIGNYTGQTPQI